MPTTSHEWLTIAEVAAEYRVSVMTIYRACETGELESVRIGRLYRINAAALDTYLTGSRAAAS